MSEIKTQPTHVLQVKEALLKVRQTCEITGLSKSSIYALLKAGRFPAPVRLGSRCTRWRMTDINAWIAQVGQ